MIDEQDLLSALQRAAEEEKFDVEQEERRADALNFEEADDINQDDAYPDTFLYGLSTPEGPFSNSRDEGEFAPESNSEVVSPDTTGEVLQLEEDYVDSIGRRSAHARAKSSFRGPTLYRSATSVGKRSPAPKRRRWFRKVTRKVGKALGKVGKYCLNNPTLCTAAGTIIG